jgi:tetraacyldisaccharide 4'-kinase
MLNASTFRDIVSGCRGGARAAVARGVLRLAEVPYTAAVNWRNRRFDGPHSAVRRVGVPVVSVGNLTLGGTGKTPMVEWIANWLVQRNVRVAIVSRGYGAAAADKNDEALELEQALAGVPHVQNPDRVAGALTAVERFGVELILLDDGFQHRRLARDLDVVLLDATAPFGFEHVFPRGMLREPVRGLQRADVVCLTRADALPA